MASSLSQPLASASSQPLAPASSQPLDSAFSQPLDSASTEVDSASPKPVDSASTQPVDSASAQPVDSASTQPVYSASPLRVDSASAKHMDATIIKIAEPSNDHTGLQLYQAIVEGDLERVRLACESNPFALKESITEKSDTILHVALAVEAVARHIVDFILSRMLDYIPEFSNTEGNTVLSVAAIVGNVQAAIIISERLPLLNTVANKSGYTPVMDAARYGQKEMIKKLLPFNEGIFHSDEDARGFDLVNLLIAAGFYDLAHELVKSYPHLAIMTPHGEDKSLLSSMARKPSAFLSGRKLDYWPRFLSFSSCTKRIDEKKLMYHKALELVQLLCGEVRKNLDDRRASSILRLPLLLTAKLGVHEVVEEILKSYPPAIWFPDEENHNAFQLAVINHQEQVIDVINRMSAHRYVLLESIDNDGNNILHLAGRQAPENQLDLIPGAALQMQRDLKWFKEMEKIVPSTCKESINSEGKTPAIVFSENHKDLVKNGESWMKTVATSGTVAATLIASLVFAATVSVPGGNKENNGKPNLNHRRSFIVFGVFDAISLLSAIAAVIMFLSLFTARYSENDFLYILPRRLILSLSLLFVSVITMTVAYGFIIYLLFFEKRKRWILFAVGTSTLVPLSLFAYSHLPLLHHLIISTYNFRKLGICICSKCYNASASSSE